LAARRSTAASSGPNTSPRERGAFLSVAIAAQARDSAIHRPLIAAFLATDRNSRTIGLTKKVHILTSGIPARRNRLSVISPVVCCRLASSNRTHPAQARGSGAQLLHTAGNKSRRSLVFTHADTNNSASSAAHCGPYQEIQT
jgi:hypothetical protein